MAKPFITNVADAWAFRHEISGTTIGFENPERPFPDTGINIQVLEPGKPSCKYHSESVQEDFLVLAGDCLMILEGEETPLRQWDFVHCPPGVAHVFVGAGGGPCWLLQIGARREGSTLDYPLDEVAARHGAQTTEPTGDGDVAYADWPEGGEMVAPPWPPSRA
jgi:uncharacterized cupin superfamily protein